MEESTRIGAKHEGKRGEGKGREGRGGEGMVALAWHEKPSQFRTWPNEFVPNAIRNLSLTVSRERCETNASYLCRVVNAHRGVIKLEHLNKNAVYTRFGPNKLSRAPCRRSIVAPASRPVLSAHNRASFTISNRDESRTSNPICEKSVVGKSCVHAF